MVISPEQCRAARAWLDWKQEELAAKAGVSLSTVRDFEKGRRTPIANNAKALAEAFGEAGIDLPFDEDDKPLGVVRRRS